MPRPRVTRYGLWIPLLGLALLGCGRRETPEGRARGRTLAASFQLPSAADSSGASVKPAVSNPALDPLARRELTWVYEETSVGPMQVVVSIPKRTSPEEKFPVLITLHGRGEAFKGPARGARGWLDDYWLPRAVERLEHPPLTARDLLFLADPERLVRTNQSLERQRYQGLIVVCPYTPDILAGDRPFQAARPLADFLVDSLLPRVYRETPALATRVSTGIDGVSLGGRASLLVGLGRPTAFGVVAGLQPAFDSADAVELGRVTELARKANPDLRLRLLTSDGDYFLEPTRAIAREWQRLGIPHELVVVPGPHNYEFNRGPGVFEMLLFHDRALRRKPAL